MKTIEITDKNKWNKFIEQQNPTSFFQSWEWGTVREKLGETPFRLAVIDGKDKITAAIQLVHIHARRGHFLYAAYGPVGDEIYFSALIFEAKKLAKKLKVVALRIQFLDEKSKKNTKTAWKNAPLFINSDNFWIKNIDERDKMLAEMRPTHRNLARRSERDTDGLSFSEGGKELLPEFLQLFRATASRQNFIAFDEKIYEIQLTEFGKKARIFLCRDTDGNPLAAAFIMFFGDTAVYHYGASIRTKLPASNGVLWRALLAAADQKCKKFNFWGIAPPEKEKNHRFSGITPFKKGWGGEFVTLPPLADLPIRKIGYFKLWIIETIRKIKRKV